MPKFQRIFLFIPVLFFSFSFCVYADSYHWQVSEDGKVYLWTKETIPFTWSGAVKGKFADGTGIVRFYDKKGGSYDIKLTLLYGAEKKHYKTLSGSTIQYVGDYEKIDFGLKPGGIGVLKKENGNVYAGDIKKGKITGFAYHFVNGILKYEGDFLDSKYSGQGKLYREGNLCYVGSFFNGKKHGWGKEFHGEAEFEGEYKDDKENGLFRISKNDTVRLVQYIEGMPQLSNGKILYADGTVWEGPLNDKFEAEGEGKTTTADGFVRDETRKENKIFGKQVIYFDDGSKYEGNIIDSFKSGYGIYSYKNGVTYYGDWLNDERHGYGELQISDDWYYLGEWKHNLFDGDGLLVFPAFTYDGGWKNGKKEGYGTLTLADGTFYEGNWQNDQIRGNGYIYFTDDSYYEGEWDNNRRSGYGEYILADGTSYYGDWLNDLPHGECEISFSNGDFYAGEVEYGFYSGSGTYIFANGERYEGEFVESKRTGSGFYSYVNGNRYQGEFKNNAPDGKGTFYFPDGTFYEGNFANGKIQGKGSLYIPEKEDYTIITSSFWKDSVMPTEGSVLFANGDEFVGVLLNGMPTEQGSWTTKEERLNGRSRAEKARDFYREHEKTIQNVFQITERVITGINIAATITTVVLTPFPPAAGIAKAVDVICDVTSIAVSATNIAIKTAVLNYDIDELKNKDANPEEIATLKENYIKNIKPDLINIGITAGVMGVQHLQAAGKLKKARNVYPKLSSSIKKITKTANYADIAKSGKFRGSLVRGTVSIAYGKIGKKLIKEYGDEAAEFLFKYGDNGLYALTTGGEDILKIAKTGGGKALEAIFSNGEKAIHILKKYPNDVGTIVELIGKKGKTGITLLEKAGDDALLVAKQFQKHGEGYFRIAQAVGPKKIRIFITITKEYGDDAVTVLKKYNDSKDLRKAVKYIDAFKSEGFKKLHQWNGKIPPDVTFDSIRIHKKISDSFFMESTKIILSKSGIELTPKVLDEIRVNPRYLRKLVYQYTGKRFSEGYKEFFIRVAKESPEQVKKLWSSSNVKNFIKNKGIRAGETHEWLMCENFMNFLTDSKWGKEGGAYLANIMTELVQNTETVIFKNGGRHGGTMSNTFHKGLYKTINECKNVEEVLSKIKIYAKETLASEGYEEFLHIFNKVLE